MTATFEQSVGAYPGSGKDGWVVFTLSGQRLATPMAEVEAISPPPPLVPVPHAPPALLGAGNIDGDILPVIDLRRLLGCKAVAIPYAGRGDILRVRAGRRQVGMWVDKVERIVHQTAIEAGGEIIRIDAARLASECLVAPRIAGGPTAAIGEVGMLAPPPPIGLAPDAFILVEAARELVKLRRNAVLELLEAVPRVALPRAPAALLGIGWLRGDAVPILSMAAILGAGSEAEPGGFLAVAVAERLVLLGVDRVIGLRAVAEAQTIDPEELLSDELRQIILGFPALKERDRPRDATAADATVPYLSFSVADQEWAVPIAEVDQLIDAQSAIEMPRFASDGETSRLCGAVEMRGQILPVAALPARLEGSTAVQRPSVYVILRGADGLGALGVDRVNQVIRLRPEDLAPPPNDALGLLAGVAARPNGALLRIIAPHRLWQA